MMCGQRAVCMPSPNPSTLLLSTGHAGFFSRLDDDLLADVHRAFERGCDRTQRTDCYLLDAVRAEFAVRHAPADPRELTLEEYVERRA